MEKGAVDTGTWYRPWSSRISQMIPNTKFNIDISIIFCLSNFLSIFTIPKSEIKIQKSIQIKNPFFVLLELKMQNL
jgi:hypothetical protein